MVEVKFYDNVADELLKFAVIISKTDNKWVFCKHKERETYEVPGGHREPGESIFETAKRELQEETGAIDFKIEPICVYSVKGKTRVNENIDDETFGMLFIADISSFVCIFRKNCASVPEERSAIPLQTEQNSAGRLITIGYSAIPARKFKAICLRCHST